VLLFIHYCKILRLWTIYHKLVLFVHHGRLLKDERHWTMYKRLVVVTSIYLPLTIISRLVTERPGASEPRMIYRKAGCIVAYAWD
jgi:hypothetical protein